MMPDCSFNFFDRGNDSQKQFNKNLKNQSLDWPYRYKEILYKNNSLGFREKEFTKIDWNNAIVVLGCSIVYGSGLANEDTIPRVIEKITNLPVVNLGVAGSSVELSFYNSLILKEQNIQPKAIVQLWTGTERYLDYNSKHGWFPMYPWNKNYVPNVDWNVKSCFYRRAFLSMWKDSTAIYEATFFENTAKEFNIEFIEIFDYARDLCHPGILSAKTCAEKICKSLNL